MDNYFASIRKTLAFISYTVETRIKGPIFIRTLRLKFNLLNPLKKNLSEADTGGGSFMIGFMSSRFLIVFKSFYILIRILQWSKRISDF